MGFKTGDVVEVRFSKFWSETAEVVEQVNREGETNYQIRYPYHSSSSVYYTEVHESALKISVFNKCRKPTLLNNYNRE